MSYLVFARKYRPQTFADVVRQEHVTTTLSNAIAAGRVPHALLFTGPRGTGKTTLARILAKAMNCVEGPTAAPCNQCRSCVEITSGHAADVFEIDGASNNSVDQVRELRDNLKFMPVHSRYKIYIIDEVHMLSLAAFNALLKTLEEPPRHVLFVFATTEPQKIPITILSRCQRHDLRRIDLAAIIENMRVICNKEQVAVDEESLELIAREAGGSMRDALSLLDHVIACADGPVTPVLVGELLGVAERGHLFALAEAVLEDDLGAVLAKIDAVWSGGLEIRRFFSDVVTFFRHLTLAKLGDKTNALIDLPENEIRRMRALVARVPEGRLVQLLDLLFQAEPSIKLSGQSKLALEMVFFKLFQTPPAASVETLIEGLDRLRSGLPVGAAPVEVAGETPAQPPADYGATVSDQHGRDTTAAPQPRPAQVEIATVPLTPPVFWERLQERATHEKPALGACLGKCNLKSLEEGRVVIEVGGNEFTLNSVRKHLSLIEEFCSAIGGVATKVDLEANIEDSAQREEQKKKDELLKQKALSHPLVLEALELFDGRVVEVKHDQ